MANMNFDDYSPKKSSKFGDRPKVGYFNSLRDDGDEALVRINYKTKSDFKVVTVHRYTVDGKWRNVSCLKESHDTDDKCPLCASGNRMYAKVFLSLIEYVKDENGSIVAEPKVWERPYKIISDIIDAFKDAVDDGFITPATHFEDVVLKIRRVGEKGSLSTQYKIKVMNPSVTPESAYVKDFSAFEGFDASHHSYSVKTAAEMEEFIATGKFPARESREGGNGGQPSRRPEAQQPAKPAAKPSTETFGYSAFGNDGGDAPWDGGDAPAKPAEPAKESPTPAPTANKPKRYAF